MEPAGRPFEASWEARSHLGGPVERPEGRGAEEIDRENGAFLVCGTVGHRRLQGRCPRASDRGTAGRASKLARKGLEPAGRASEPAGRT